MLLQPCLASLFFLFLEASVVVSAGETCRSQEIELCINPSRRSRPVRLPDERIVCPYQLPPVNTFKFGTYGYLMADDESLPYNKLLELCASVSQTHWHDTKEYQPRESFNGRCDLTTRRMVWADLKDEKAFHSAYFYELLRLSKINPPWDAEALPPDTIKAMSNLAWQQRRNTLNYCISHCFCFDAWVELNKVGLEKGFPQFPLALRFAMNRQTRARIP